jgi:hypothetical protein
MNNVRRQASGRILHAFCSIADSSRVLLVRDVAESGGLGEKEWEIIQKKSANIKKEVEAIRKLANIIERRSAR